MRAGASRRRALRLLCPCPCPASSLRQQLRGGDAVDCPRVAARRPSARPRTGRRGGHIIDRIAARLGRPDRRPLYTDFHYVGRDRCGQGGCAPPARTPCSISWGIRPGARAGSTRRTLCPKKPLETEGPRQVYLPGAGGSILIRPIALSASAASFRSPSPGTGAGPGAAPWATPPPFSAWKLHHGRCNWCRRRNTPCPKGTEPSDVHLSP